MARGVPRPVTREPGSCLVDARVEQQAAVFDIEHAVGDRERPVDALLGEHDGAAGLLDGGEKQLGAGRVELRRRLVEQQQPRLERERGREADALQLSARELDGTPPPEMRGPDVGERRLNPRPDQLWCDTEVLEAEGDLVADPRHHDLVLRILEDGRDGAGELGRPVRATRVEAGDLDTAREAAAVEVRHEAGERPQQRRLARPGRPEQRDDLALAQLEGDVTEHGRPARIGERKPFDAR